MTTRSVSTDTLAAGIRSHDVMPDVTPDGARSDGAWSDDGGAVCAALRDRIMARAGPGAAVMPAERVTLLRVNLPIRGRHRRLQAVPFALEDRLAAPIETVHCALHPAWTDSASLAAVIDRAKMSETSGPVIAETMAVPTPQAEEGQTAWAVWREGSRAVVRASDGTGFAAHSEILPLLWARAGRPAVTRLGAELPEEMAAVDLSDVPPPPDAVDLRFDLRQGMFAVGGRHWPGTLKAAAGIVAAGLLLHLALAMLDRAALARVASVESAQAVARLESRLPGVPPDIGAAALTDRLAPRDVAAAGSTFLPLLTETAAAMIVDAPQTQVQRLTWDTQSGELMLDVTARTLEDLQSIERILIAADFPAQSGVATAGDGAARAEIRIGPRP